MAVTYNSTVKDNRMTQVLNAIDGGAGPGTLEIGTAGFGSVLAILTLADPCGTVSGGVLTFDTTPAIEDAAANAAGTAAEARIKDSTGTIVVSGLTVGTSGANINLNKTNIAVDDVVQITSATITHG